MAAITQKLGPSTVAQQQSAEVPKGLDSYLNLVFDGGSSSLRALKAGKVYKIERSGDTYVVRQAWSFWTQERCEREIEIAKVAAATGIAPQILSVSPDSFYSIIEYYNGGTLDLSSTLDLPGLANCLRRLHAVELPKCMQNERLAGADSPLKSTTLSRMERQYEIIKEMYGKLPDDVEKMYEMGQALAKEFYARYPEGRVLAHLDLHVDNLMKHNGELRLIDFGMSGPDHPYNDLANAAMYLSLSAEDERELLRSYIGVESLSDEQWQEYAFFRPLAYINKVTYPLMQAHMNQSASAEYLSKQWSQPQTRGISYYFAQIPTAENETRSAEDAIDYAHAACKQFFCKVK